MPGTDGPYRGIRGRSGEWVEGAELWPISSASILNLLAGAAQASPEVTEDPGALAAHIAGLPGGEKDRLLMLVGRDKPARAKMELLRICGQSRGATVRPVSH